MFSQTSRVPVNFIVSCVELKL